MSDSPGSEGFRSGSSGSSNKQELLSEMEPTRAWMFVRRFVYSSSPLFDDLAVKRVTTIQNLESVLEKFKVHRPEFSPLTSYCFLVEGLTISKVTGEPYNIRGFCATLDIPPFTGQFRVHNVWESLLRQLLKPEPTQINWIGCVLGITIVRLHSLGYKISIWTNIKTKMGFSLLESKLRKFCVEPAAEWQIDLKPNSFNFYLYDKEVKGKSTAGSKSGYEVPIELSDPELTYEDSPDNSQDQEEEKCGSETLSPQKPSCVSNPEEDTSDSFNSSNNNDMDTAPAQIGPTSFSGVLNSGTEGNESGQTGP